MLQSQVDSQKIPLFGVLCTVQHNALRSVAVLTLQLLFNDCFCMIIYCTDESTENFRTLCRVQGYIPSCILWLWWCNSCWWSRFVSQSLSALTRCSMYNTIHSTNHSNKLIGREVSTRIFQVNEWKRDSCVEAIIYDHHFPETLHASWIRCWIERDDCDPSRHPGWIFTQELGLYLDSKLDQQTGWHGTDQ